MAPRRHAPYPELAKVGKKEPILRRRSATNMALPLWHVSLPFP
jgi:hypothetical protein